MKPDLSEAELYKDFGNDYSFWTSMDYVDRRFLTTELSSPISCGRSIHGTKRAAVCVYSVNKNSGMPIDSLDEMMRLYNSDPETITAEYEFLLDWKAGQNRIALEQMKLGNIGYTPEKLQNRYALDGFDDLELFDELFRLINRISNFSGSIDDVIEDADNNIAAFRKMGSPRTHTIQNINIIL